jgi:hypothetical protein
VLRTHIQSTRKPNHTTRSALRLLVIEHGVSMRQVSRCSGPRKWLTR